MKILLLSLLLPLALAACGDERNSTAPHPDSVPSPGIPSTPENSLTIVILPSGFGETPLVLGPGTMVTWLNSDSVAHTATETSGLWDSGAIAPGQTYSRQFTAAGIFAYHCRYFSQLRGTIEVLSRSPGG